MRRFPRERPARKYVSDVIFKEYQNHILIMSIDIIKQQTKDLIDRLKSTTNNIGLGNSGNEYTVIVETFLYKFLNDKFIYEAKRTLPELADAEDVYEALERLPDEGVRGNVRYDARHYCIEERASDTVSCQTSE